MAKIQKIRGDQEDCFENAGLNPQAQEISCYGFQCAVPVQECSIECERYKKESVASWKTKEDLLEVFKKRMLEEIYEDIDIIKKSSSVEQLVETFSTYIPCPSSLGLKNLQPSYCSSGGCQGCWHYALKQIKDTI